MAEQPTNLCILLIVHGLPPADCSGTTAIAHAYARQLTARGLRVGVLYGGPPPDRNVPLRLFTDEHHGFRRYQIPPTPHLWQKWSIYDSAAAARERCAVLQDVLENLRPDLVHVVDLGNLPGEWASAIHARGIPLLRQVWNTEDLCGLVELLGARPPAVTCPAPLTPRQCAECCFRSMVSLTLPAGRYAAEELLGSLTALRTHHLAEFERHLVMKRQRAEDAFLHVYDRILFPTESFRRFFERTLPLPPERTAVHAPGIDLAMDRPATRPTPDGRVRFLFLGQLLSKKGLDDLVAVFSHPDLLRRADYELTLHGGGNAAVLRGLLAANPRVHYRGPFTAAQLPGILRDADVGLSPSRFETFHRVTREYQAAGLAVIGSIAFGIPEAVSREENGLLFAAGDVDGFRRAVLRLLDDRQLLARLREGAAHTPVRPVEQEVDELLDHYAECIRRKRHDWAMMGAPPPCLIPAAMSPRRSTPTVRLPHSSTKIG
jgi:glycosyltransferase involved in cell wall biosynthesis